MRSLILTILYLAKDTLHRWYSNIASPTARVLVVYFLTLCALFFLGSYVISTKLVREQIQKQGADTVSMVMGQAKDTIFPSAKDIKEQLHADSLVLRSISHAMDPDLRGVPVFSYDFNRTTQILPLLANGGPTLFCSAESKVPAGLRSLSVNRQNITCQVRILPEEHPILRLTRGVCLIIPPRMIEQSTNRPVKEGGLQVLLQLNDGEVTVEKLQKLEEYLRTYSQLESKQSFIISAIKLLRNMDVLLSNQGQTRAIFCLGIAGIVGILLTSLASMEYRQNEYIYTLLKSFGIAPILLVFCFIMENIILVGLSFLLAIITFMQAQKILLTQFSQHGSHLLQLEEILPEIQLIGISLAICVLISTIPIAIAANKEIGKVLK
ncbi:MAG: hypothetical protein R3Y56_05740 [Akkermansia sp.]